MSKNLSGSSASVVLVEIAASLPLLAKYLVTGKSTASKEAVLNNS